MFSVSLMLLFRPVTVPRTCCGGFVLTKPHNSDYFYSCAQIKYKSVNLKKVHINFFLINREEDSEEVKLITFWCGQNCAKPLKDKEKKLSGGVNTC